MSTSLVVELLPEKSLKKLQNEYEILHLLYVRNYNQHRVAKWWRYFEMIHLNVRKILKKAYNMETSKKIRVREKLRMEAVNIARYMVRKKLFTKAFFEFNGIIALGQFVALGFALLGGTSSVFSLLNEIDGVQSSHFGVNSESKAETPVAGNDDDDLGVEVEIPQEKLKPSSFDLQVRESKPIKVDLFGKTKKKRRSEESKVKESKKLRDGIDSIFEDTTAKRKKKKKKKSAMDDIFG